MSVTQELEELAKEYPEDTRRLAEKADGPIRDRLLRLLAEGEN